MLPPTQLGTPGRLITGAGEFDRPGPQGGQGRQDGGARGQEGGGPDDGAGHGPRHHDGGRDAQQRQRAPHDQQVHRGDHAPEHRAHPDRLGDDEPQDLRDAGPGETEHGEIAAPSGGGPAQGVGQGCRGGEQGDAEDHPQAGAGAVVGTGVGRGQPCRAGRHPRTGVGSGGVQRGGDTPAPTRPGLDSHSLTTP